MNHRVVSFVLVAVMSAMLIGCGDKPKETQTQAKPAPTTQTATPSEPAPSEPAAQEQPAPEPAPQAEAPTAAVAPLSIEEGKKRYEASCKVCHDQGLLDAPKLGDKAAWQARIAKGKDVLYTHSAKGFNKMPAQATGDISEAEVYAAVDYMLQKSS